MLLIFADGAWLLVVLLLEVHGVFRYGKIFLLNLIFIFNIIDLEYIVNYLLCMIFFTNNQSK